jgi:hypothetical protein
MSLLKNDSVKIEVLRYLNDGLSYAAISEKLGIPRTTINTFALKKSYKSWWEENKKPIASGTVHDQHTNIKKLNKTRYIVTSAQNNTFVHNGFLKSLENMANDIDAQIIVGTFAYNTNGFQSLQKGEGEWFDPSIIDYILDEPAMLADGLIWCGELNILPTAVNPISGLHSYTRSSSGIIPHAKVQLESIPTHITDPVRMMYTTGAVTKQNYVQKKAGQKATFHHVFGALLVEVDEDGLWFVRQLIADSDTGYFYDLDTYYTDHDVHYNVRVEGINWGDVHIEKMDHMVAYACFNGPDNMLDVLNPAYQFVNDVVDFSSRNHHNINDPYFKFMMQLKKTEKVEDNIKMVGEFLKSIESKNTMTIVVESNHDLAFKRWLKESDYKNDPVNAIYFLQNQLAIYNSMQEGNNSFSIFEYAVMKTQPSLENVKFLRTDESFRICDNHGNGVECGDHGHNGNNGARGGIKSFQVRGSRYNIGHSHSAGIKDGVYQAGHLTDISKMTYVKGASSWSHSNIITYQNGKRAMVTIKNGKWRA